MSVRCCCRMATSSSAGHQGLVPAFRHVRSRDRFVVRDGAGQLPQAVSLGSRTPAERRDLATGGSNFGGGSNVIEISSPPYLFKAPGHRSPLRRPRSDHAAKFDIESPQADDISRIVMVRPMARSFMRRTLDEAHSAAVHAQEEDGRARPRLRMGICLAARPRAPSCCSSWNKKGCTVRGKIGFFLASSHVRRRSQCLCPDLRSPLPPGRGCGKLTEADMDGSERVDRP